MAAHEEIKAWALDQISGVATWVRVGRANYKVDGTKVHVRFCGTDNAKPYKYKFNINPTTLKADYELWICGSSEITFFMPTALMESMYRDPNAYIDSRHPEIRIVTVDSLNKIVQYARGSKMMDLSEYYRRNLR